MDSAATGMYLTPPPPIVPAAPGEGARLVGLVGQFETTLDEMPGALCQLDEAELAAMVGLMLRIAGRVENVAVLAIADAVNRGTVANSTATGAPAWVQQHSYGVDPVIARRVGAVGVDCADPKNQIVAQALAAGTASVPAAAVALREVPRTLRNIPTADRAEMLLTYLSLTSFGPRALTELSVRITGQYAPELLVRNEEIQQQCESVRSFDLTNGLTRIVAELSRAHAATVKHALRALSAPIPQPCPSTQNSSCDRSDTGDDGGSDVSICWTSDSGGGLPETGPNAPERDTRTPAKRRADALMHLIETAAGALDGTAARPVGDAGGTAKLIITLDCNTLYAGLRDAEELPIYLPGVGRTSDGDLIDAGTLRRLACDADIIPVVLGGASEPLDVGRAERLFTGALRTAVIHRDQGCTFPGCDRPPDWCDAHHVNPWWTGGETKLENAALLCARHHTIVHRDLLTADVTATGVTWNPISGLMPTRCA